MDGTADRGLAHTEDQGQASNQPREYARPESGVGDPDTGGIQPLVLAPLDDSPLAEAALSHALALAGITSGDLELLRVVQPSTIVWPGPGPVPMADPQLIEDVRQAAFEEANSYMTDLLKRLAATGVEVRTRILEGYPASEIVRQAQQGEGATVIAMATHGNSGFKRWLLGSVSEKVLSTSPVPLLLVRPAQDYGRQERIVPAPTYKLILVPLDGSPFAEQALAEARLLATRIGATVVLLSVLLFTEDYLRESVASEPWAVEDRAEAERMAAYLSDTARRLREEGLQVRTHLVHGYPPEEILRVSEELGADIVVMTTQGRSGLQVLWLGSVARKVVEGSPLPVLLIRPGELQGQDQPGA